MSVTYRIKPNPPNTVQKLVATPETGSGRCGIFCDEDGYHSTDDVNGKPNSSTNLIRDPVGDGISDDLRTDVCALVTPE